MTTSVRRSGSGGGKPSARQQPLQASLHPKPAASAAPAGGTSGGIAASAQEACRRATCSRSSADDAPERVPDDAAPAATGPSKSSSAPRRTTRTPVAPVASALDGTSTPSCELASESSVLCIAVTRSTGRLPAIASTQCVLPAPCSPLSRQPGPPECARPVAPSKFHAAAMGPAIAPCTSRSRPGEAAAAAVAQARSAATA